MSPVALITFLAALVGGAFVVVAIVKLVRVVQSSVIARLPLVADQEVRLPEAGRVDLYVEQPTLAWNIGGFTFAMRDAVGREVPSSLILMRTRVSGMARTRLAVRSFAVPAAGLYRILSGGFDGRDVSRIAIVLGRPFGFQLVGWILAIVFGGFVLIGGLVVGGLTMAGKGW
jgi:hypothetical protein